MASSTSTTPAPTAAASSGTGTIEVRHGFTEMGQGVHTVALQVAVEELGVDPARIKVIVDTTREIGFGQTTGSRGTLMAAGAVQKACQAALAAGLHAGRRPPRRARRRLDAEARRPERAQPDDPRRVRLRRADRRRRPGDRGDREGHRHPRRRPGGQPAAVRGPDRGLGAHGPRLRADRGLPVRRARLPDEHDPAQPRHPAAPRTCRRSRSSWSRSPSRKAAYGIKGVGEIGLVPTAGAVAAALHMVDGEWRTTLPMRSAAADD